MGTPEMQFVPADPESLAVQKPSPGLPVFAGVNVEALLAKAVDANAAVDVLERLMAMRRELQAEAAKAGFDKAMAAFQAECPVISKSSEVFQKNSTAVRYRYATLDAIVHQVKGLLEKHGLSHSETAQVEPGWVTAVCTVKHAQGHSEKSEFKVPVDPEAYMNEAQKFASALTFAKRYAFCNAFGILTGDADDDSRASGTQPESPKANPPSQPVKTPPRATQEPLKPILKQTETPKATPETRARMVESLLALENVGEAMVLDYFRKLEKPAVLLETEGLHEIPLRFVPITQKQFESMKAALLEFCTGAPARHGFPANETTSEPAAPHIAAAPPRAAPPVSPSGGPRAEGAYADEPWYAVIVPVPNKGQKRDEYLKNPDTIGSLYLARHGNDEESATARRRLWGFVNNYEAKGWTKTNGQQMPPSKADVLFREALDQFAAYFEKNHPGEKL